MGQSDPLAAAIFAAVTHLPKWLRSDLAAKSPAVRCRAEETLAAMLRAAIIDGDGAPVARGKPTLKAA